MFSEDRATVRQPVSGHSAGGGGGSGALCRSACRAFSSRRVVSHGHRSGRVVRGRRGGARRGTAGTAPAGTLRRPSPAHRTVRSTGGPPAPYGPVASCPAPAVPSHGRASRPGPAAARSQGNGIAHHSAAAVPSPQAPYREGRQSGSPGVEREPDETSAVDGEHGDGGRRGGCGRQPTADGTRPRCGEALTAGGPEGVADAAKACGGLVPPGCPRKDRRRRGPRLRW